MTYANLSDVSTRLGRPITTDAEISQVNAWLADDVTGGRQCKALSGHIDFVPTLLAFAGATPAQAAEYAGRPLPGEDLSGLLGNPESRGIDAVRDATLFTYSGLASNDAGVFDFGSRARGARTFASGKYMAAQPGLMSNGRTRMSVISPASLTIRTRCSACRPRRARSVGCSRITSRRSWPRYKS